MRIIKQIATTLLLTAQMMAASTGAWADEGGTSFWLPGQYASFAAVPPAPGWSLSSEIYYDSGGESASKTFSQGETISAGSDSREVQLLLTPAYTPLTKVMGGSAALSLTGGYGRDWVQDEISVSSRGNELDRSDAVSGFTDLSPTASLAWNRGVHNGMIYLTGNIPVGSYDSQRLANIGIGFWAIDAGGGYTYFNQQTGREFSTVIGCTYNFENNSTDYQNGIDSHLDWSVSQLLSAAWTVGIAGYVYYQLTGDSGSGDRVGPFKARVAAIGPQVGYMFNVGDQQWSANVRGYYEFWAKNRPEGYALFANINIPIGVTEK
ncbi:MAG: transporter [Desulfobacterales bacterium]